MWEGTGASEQPALRQRDGLMGLLLESARDLVFVIGRDGRLRYANAAAAAQVGRPADNLVGELWRTLFRPAQAGGLLDPAAHVFETGEPLYHEERLRLSRGEIPLGTWLTPVRDPAGKIVAVLAVARDLDDRREVMSLTERFYLGLFDQFPTPIWRAGRDGRCDYFNKAWLEFTGRTMEEEAGDGWAAGVHPNDFADVMARYLEAFTARHAFCLEYRLRRHDGQYRWLLDYGNPFWDLDGSFAGYVGSCYDITERRQVDELREQYIHSISHDLRTPLSVILGMAEYLQMNAPQLGLSGQAIRSVDAILRSGRTLRGLTNDLLDAARLDSGPIKLNLQWLELVPFLRELASTLAGPERLTVEVSGQLPAVLADPPRLERILTNLVGNALKYSDEPVRIVASFDPDRAEVTVCVADRGPGIPPELLPFVFDRYRRGEHPSDRGGLGLGLYIAKGLAEAHGGRLTVKSTPGDGCSFYLHLPMSLSR